MPQTDLCLQELQLGDGTEGYLGPEPDWSSGLDPVDLGFQTFQGPFKDLEAF